jgi:fibronectin type 3 domain-containing protein
MAWRVRSNRLQVVMLALLPAALWAGCGGGYGGGGGGGGSAPAVPTGLAAAGANAQVNLTWTASSGATLYYVKRSTTSGGPYTQIGTPSVTMFADTSVSNGTKYDYVVSAYNSYGQSANSAEASATPVAPPPPAVPSGLTATPGHAEVVLSWTAVSGAASYNVKRATTSGGPYSTVHSTAMTSYTDTGLNNGTKYYYVVSAVSNAVESANSAQVAATPANVAADVTITIDPLQTKAISPYIYGTNFYSGNTAPQPNFTFDRDGGNRWTAYNWESNASNAGSDYLYESDAYLSSSNVAAEAVRSFIATDQGAGLASLVTFQMQGYVAADEAGPVLRPFPNLARFKQVIEKKSTKDAAPFTTNPPTSNAYVYMDEFAWALDQKFPANGIFGASPALPTFISLDNEPDLWSSTHEEIQGSTNISSDNFVTTSVTLSKALKDQFPNLVIFGAVNYGFNGIYSWQGDPTLSPTPNGANWFADKYLAGIKTASTAYGKPVVDVYDFHWYSEATDGGTRVITMTGSNLTAAQIEAIVQSPRSLWDPTFTENSWITNSVLGGPIQILSRLEAKIAANNPGMKISISEYENGGFNHIAGTIAQADNLGIFGSQGVFAANFWPPNGTYSYVLAGFRAFRGFDGATANFGDTSLQATSSNVHNVVVYASLDSKRPGRVVLVAINRSTVNQVTAISGQPVSATAHIYQMTAASAQAQVAAGNPVEPVSAGTMAASGATLTITLPALSVTTIAVE